MIRSWEFLYFGEPKKIVQFGFRDMKAPNKDATLDCRVIPNPWGSRLTDDVMVEKVKSDPHYEALVSKGLSMLDVVDTLYVGCAYGKHRSRAVAAEIVRRASRVGKVATNEQP